ncbi:hypothetical protein ASG22_19630 [Chryseobacterium sp. Leaf405]|uniref:YecA family protein n=1 Tax=Chryseobacterium sp. Leaf405 TaxID=1736367 RepID=UPI0006FAF606|nr:hypothetical protein [Chryseobacterium sp. Leaf405]KQT30908.1 hypothetical protein ASG22_19630 [Chryseobacterium sp. Leaf405]
MKNIYDPCNCGSGKKIKFCCGIKGNNDTKFNLSTYINNNNSTELLKIFALLQVLPENSSKILRLQNIQKVILQNLNTNHDAINYEILRNVVKKNFPPLEHEDPNECCFVENIMFFNGNNLVFTGITDNTREINQYIIDSIISDNDKISSECKKEIFDGIKFLLHIHHEIALKLNIKRNEFIENYNEVLEFPSNENLENYKDLFVFKPESIDKICIDNEIDKNIINEFLLDIKVLNSTDDILDLDLLKRPFINYNGMYYLYLPSAEMHVLNQFVVSKLKKYNELKKFEATFYDHFRYMSIKTFLKMSWTLNDHFEHFDIFQFDTNKFAIVEYRVSDSTFNTKTIIDFVESQNKSDEFIYITLVGIFDKKGFGYIEQKKINGIKYSFMLTLMELNILIVLWDLNRLSIWKYLVADDIRNKESILIPNLYNILVKYYWYQKNNYSFLPNDKATPELIHFDFKLQGAQAINAIQKTDKHVVLFYELNGDLVFRSVTRTETYAPIYLSENFINGWLEIVLERYNFPIWITSTLRYDSLTKNFADSILYWLNKFYPELKNYIDNYKYPINVELRFDVAFHNLDGFDFNHIKDFSKSSLDYIIDYEVKKISIDIPFAMYNLFKKNDNSGEKVLLQTVLIGISDLLNYDDISLSQDNIDTIFSEFMPLSMAKMIIAYDNYDNIRYDNRFIPQPRYLEEADTSIILQNLISWGNINISTTFDTRDKKIEICNFIIKTLIDKVSDILVNYNTIDLIQFVMLRNESLLHQHSFSKIRMVTYYECFKDHIDAFNDFLEKDNRNVRTRHATRGLIEFILAEKHLGTKMPNDNDIDFLTSLLDEISFFGNMLDSIKFEFNDPDMSILPSKRLGINYSFHNKVNQYNLEMKKDEHIDSINYFTDIYEDHSDQSAYYNKINKIYDEDLGIALFKIIATYDKLSRFILENKVSVYVFKTSDFHLFLKQECELTEKEIHGFINNFVLTSRGEISKPPQNYQYSDIQPWRYNRSLSYLIRPIVFVDECYIISARHLSSSSENYLAKFMDGTIKYDKKLKGLAKLQAERNKIKGTQFRKEVYEWLKNEYNNLEIIPYEFNINHKIADKNYGDIDILAFDKNKKIIYSIECKNTKQAKIIYEFTTNIKNYVEDKLPLHNNRRIWLENNLKKMSIEFKYDFTDFKVKSILVSSYKLPLNMIGNIKNVEIFSLNELKRKVVTF